MLLNKEFKKLAFLIFILFSVYSTPTYAHNPSHSGVLLYQINNNLWALQVSAPLAAFEYEVHNRFGKESYKTPEEFNQLVLNILSENISLSFNGAKNIELKNGIVKLGHESTVVYQINNIPDIIDSFIFKNTSFINISKNQSLLIVSRKNGSKNKFTLNKGNNHSIKITTIDSKFVEIINKKVTNDGQSIKIFIIIGVVLLIIIMVYLGFRKKERTYYKS